MGSIDERQQARALAAQARDAAWAADDTAWQQVLRAISGARWGWPPTGLTLIRLDAPWQDTPSSERPGWRERAAHLGPSPPRSSPAIQGHAPMLHHGRLLGLGRMIV